MAVGRKYPQEEPEKKDDSKEPIDIKRQLELDPNRKDMIERISKLFDRKTNHFYVILYGSTAFAILFFLINVIPFLSEQNLILELENLEKKSNNSTEKQLIEDNSIWP